MEKDKRGIAEEKSVRKRIASLLDVSLYGLINIERDFKGGTIFVGKLSGKILKDE